MIPGEIDYLMVPKHEFLSLTAKLAEAEERVKELEKDAKRLDWIEAANTLHQQTEFLYVVDGFQLSLVNDRTGDKVFHADNIRAVIDAAIERSE